MMTTRRLLFNCFITASIAVVSGLHSVRAEDLVTYSWSGTILPDPNQTSDPWNIGAGKPFTVSATLLDRDKDTYPTTYAVARYYARSAALTVDGVLASTDAEFPGLITFNDNVQLAYTSDVLNIIGYYAVNGVSL